MNGTGTKTVWNVGSGLYSSDCQAQWLVEVGLLVRSRKFWTSQSPPLILTLNNTSCISMIYGMCYHFKREAKRRTI